MERLIIFMKIRIVKNAKNINSKMLFNNSVLRVEKEETGVEGVLKCRYFLYDIEKNEQSELLKDINKYNLIDIRDVEDSDEYVYFCSVDDISKEIVRINIIKYDIVTGIDEVIYTFEERMEKYLSYMQTKMFILNADFIIIQNEFLRANFTETLEGYFDFELHLFNVKEDKVYKIYDENLVANGISDMVYVTENVCAIKTGFSLLQEERYNLLSKSEVSVEAVSFVNVGQLVSDMMIMKQTIVLNTIEQAYFETTIPYIERNGAYLIYSKVNFEKREEEIVFYNYEKKESKLCINTNIYSESDLGKPVVMGGFPYLLHSTSKGVDFYNIEKNKVDASFDNSVIIESVTNDFVITSERVKGLLGKEKDYINVYKYPLMNLVHKEKGIFKGCLAKEDDEIYILINQ